MSGSASGSGAASVASGTGSGAAAGAMVGGPWGAAIGAGIGFVGSLISANDQANIDQEKAALAKGEADEVARRELANDANARQASWKAQADISSESAAQGEGVGIGSQLEIRRQTELQIQLNDQAARFQESQLIAGAKMESDLADSTRTAGYFGAARQGVILAGGLASPQAGIFNYSGTQALPAIPEGY